MRVAIHILFVKIVMTSTFAVAALPAQRARASAEVGCQEFLLILGNTSGRDLSEKSVAAVAERVLSAEQAESLRAFESNFQSNQPKIDRKTWDSKTVTAAKRWLDSMGAPYDVRSEGGVEILVLRPGEETDLNRWALVEREYLGGELNYSPFKLGANGEALTEPSSNRRYLSHAAIRSLRAESPEFHETGIHGYLVNRLKVGKDSACYGWAKRSEAAIREYGKKLNEKFIYDEIDLGELAAWVIELKVLVYDLKAEMARKAKNTRDPSIDRKIQTMIEKIRKTNEEASYIATQLSATAGALHEYLKDNEMASIGVVYDKVPKGKNMGDFIGSNKKDIIWATISDGENELFIALVSGKRVPTIRRKLDLIHEVSDSAWRVLYSNIRKTLREEAGGQLDVEALSKEVDVVWKIVQRAVDWDGN